MSQDTNPIFLFNKEMILCDRAPTIPKTTFSIENEMEMKVEESLMMPAVFHTVASRTQLAVVPFSHFNNKAYTLLRFPTKELISSVVLRPQQIIIIMNLYSSH